jgi:predicted phage-related endonuclease
MDTGLSVEANREEWQNARYDNVTCTDIGKILGVDTGCSRRMLLKTKLERRDPLLNANEMTQSLLRMGLIFETTVKATFKRMWESSLMETEEGFTPSMHSHTHIPWFTGTPDYIIPGKRALAEFKSHFFPSIDEVTPIGDVTLIPPKHYLQVQGYLEIMDYDVGYLLSWTLKNGATLFKIKRDQYLFNQVIKPAITEFHDWMDRLKELDHFPSTKELSFAVYPKNHRERILYRVTQSLLLSTLTVIKSYGNTGAKDTADTEEIPDH